MARIEVLRFGVFEVDVHARELRRQGRRIHLQDKPFELLVALTERPNQVISREELHRKLWAADTYVAFDDGLNTAAAKLREALGDSARGARFVETIQRQGYRWVAPIERVVDTAASDPVIVLTPPASPAVEPVRQKRRLPGPLLTALLGASALVVVVAAIERRHDPSAVLGRFEIEAPPNTVFANDGLTPNATLSPDGRHLLFIASQIDDSHDRIWIRPLNAVEARPLAGTEGAWAPFWSPDGRKIAFVAGRRLKIADLETGTVTTLADAPTAMSGSWSGRGEIVYGPSPDGTLLQIPAAGGLATPLTSLNRPAGDRRHLWPQFLSDGRHVLYLAQRGGAVKSVIVLASLTSGESHEIAESEAAAAYAAPGHLLFVRDAVLFAQPLDVDEARLVGQPTPLAAGVGVNVATGRAFFTVSESGSVAFWDTRRLPLFQLVWFDYAGRRLGNLGALISSRHIALSPDDRDVAIEAEDPNTRDPDLWVVDVARGTRSRIVGEPVQEEGTIWSPDGAMVLYARHRGNQAPADLYTTTRSGATSLVLSAGNVSVHPTDWSSVRNLMLYELETTAGAADIWAVSAPPGSTPAVVVSTAADERDGHLSPDGRWLAYSSDETGQRAIYIRPFDRHDVDGPIFVAAGSAPRWKPDGRELLFSTPDRAIAAVGIVAQRPHVVAPRTLIELGGLVPRGQPVQYCLSRDDRRLLVATVEREPKGAPINIVTNWTAAITPSRAQRLWLALGN